MPLSYNLQKVRDFQQLHSDTEQATITNHIIFNTMYLNYNRILTDKDVAEFHRRYWIHCTIYSIPPLFTLEDIARRKGLSTNASHVSAGKFKHDTMRRLNGLYTATHRKEQ